MSAEEGFTIELTTKQAAVTFLFVGLVLGGASGLAAGAYAFGVQETDSPASSDSGQQQKDSGSDTGDTVSLEGVEFEGEPSKGENSAPIKVIEYTDYGCPFCAEWSGFDASGRIPIDKLDVSGKLEDQYVEKGEVEFILKDYPVPGLHPNGPDAHKAANCVYQESQENYWSYHDELLERRNQWMQSGQGETEKTFSEISNDLGLDTDAIMQCYENSDNSEANNDKASIVNAAGRQGTPVFFIGNREKGFIKLSGAQPISRFQDAINRIKSR